MKRNKLAGRRIRLHGNYIPLGHIVREMRGKGGEPLLLCATWSSRKRWWQYEIVFADIIDMYEVT
jgi:hypothetical protein